MPSPIAHLIAGGMIAGKCERDRGRFAGKLLLVCLFFSMAPDLDAIPGFIGGDLARFHNNLTHSPIFGLAVTVVLAPAAWLFLEKRWRLGRVALLVGGCYLLHIGMDWLTRGRGIMLGWPFTEDRFMAPVQLFYGLRWSEGVLSPYHLITAVNELLVMGIVWLLVMRRRPARNAP